MAKILVVGSLNMDMVLDVDHRPAAGETILCEKMTLVPGGKGANQACAAGRLGTDAAMLGAVGTDSYGEQLLGSLLDASVDVSGVLKKTEAGTGMAFITVDRNGENSIVVASGANGQFLPEDIERQRQLLEHCEIVILQLEIPMETVLYTAKLARSLGKTVILDPAPVPEVFPEELYRYVDLIKPNETELSRLTGLPVTKETLPAAVQLLKDRGVRQVVVTLGEEGACVAAEGEALCMIPARRVQAVDTTAAGDSFTAALAAMLLEGRSLKEAAEFANLVSSIVVTRKGAQSSIPTMEEVRGSFF